jgi:hypothetical protein
MLNDRSLLTVAVPTYNKSEPPGRTVQPALLKWTTTGISLPENAWIDDSCGDRRF